MGRCVVVEVQDKAARHSSFAPVIDRHSELLILGSLPSAQSLQKGEYYGNPRNQFWALLCTAYGEAPVESWEDKLALLARRRIALWDMVASAEREGSLDAAIRREEVNDIGGLLVEYPGVRRVLLNGGKAAALYRRHCKGLTLPVFALPSSSPMRGRNVKGFEEKLALWREALL